MKRIYFTKMVATGNDFIVIDYELEALKELAVKLCDRKNGIGSDGLLVIGRSNEADVKMRIFNPDGSEAEMCGNGLRCVALYTGEKHLEVETNAGVYKAQVAGKDRIKVEMADPKAPMLNFPIRLSSREIRVNFIDTGVPHTVVFVHGLDEIDIASIGRNMRSHKAFMPKGTNVDFVEVIDDKNIKMRTYERGVEAETLACGTGAVASAIITSVKCKVLSVKNKMNVITKGGRLKVYFENDNDRIKNVYLEGEAKKVFEGSIEV